MTVPLSLLIVHFVADFLFQTDKMALNKSKSNEWLTKHALVYATPFALWGFTFAVVTFLTHWATDYITSRCTSKLFFFRNDALDGCDPPLQTEWRLVPWKRHWFFVVIGLDQLIHFTTLALTYRLLIGG